MWKVCGLAYGFAPIRYYTYSGREGGGGGVPLKTMKYVCAFFLENVFYV